MGLGLVSQTLHSFTVGRYHKVPALAAPSTYDAARAILADDDVFVVGNGTSDTDRSNALEVKRKGNMRVSGTIISDTPAGGIPMGMFGRQ